MKKHSTITGQVRERFGSTGTHWSIIDDDGEVVLRRLVETLFPGRKDLRIIEIGTHQGVSAAILAEYGIVHTFDVVDWSYRDEIIEHLGAGHRIVFSLVPTSNHGKGLPTGAARTKIIEEGNEWLSVELRSRTFDFVFIDGNHDYDSVVSNFESVNHCGCVIFHDYRHEPLHKDRTVRFVDSVEREYGGTITRMEPFAVWKDGRDV